MKDNVVVEISNFRRIQTAVHAAIYGSHDTPRIILIYGPVGLGKTKSSQRICTDEDGVWLRAKPDWTSNWMLGDLAHELGAERGWNSQINYQRCVGALTVRPRPIFIDDVDNLAPRRRYNQVETLRAIHDETEAPLILTGMSDFPRAARTIPQLATRVAEWVECLPCDLRDVRMLAEGLCDIEIADDLLRKMQEETDGKARGIRVLLGRIERFAHRRHQRKVALDDLPKDFPFVYGLRRNSTRAQEASAETPLRSVGNAGA